MKALLLIVILMLLAASSARADPPADPRPVEASTADSKTRSPGKPGASRARRGTRPPQRTVRIGAAQPRRMLIDYRVHQPGEVLRRLDATLAELEKLIHRAAGAGCDALVLPEDTLGLGNWEAGNPKRLREILPPAVDLMVQRLGRAAEKRDQAWLYVDLGAVRKIDRANLLWGWKIHPSAFTIDVARAEPDKAGSWATVHQATDRPYETWEATDRIRFGPAEARYVRVSATKRAGNQTWAGYHLMALEVPVKAP